MNIRLKTTQYLLANLRAFIENECEYKHLTLTGTSYGKYQNLLTLLYGYAEIGVISWREVFTTLDLVISQDYDGAVEYLHLMGETDNA